MYSVELSPFPTNQPNQPNSLRNYKASRADERYDLSKHMSLSMQRAEDERPANKVAARMVRNSFLHNDILIYAAVHQRFRF